MTLRLNCGSIKLPTQFINIVSAKNKVFFAGTFGFAPFYSYIFIGLGPAGGKPAVKIIAVAPDVFRKGGKLFIIADFTGQDGIGRLFYILSQSFFVITMSLPFELTHLKLGQ
jgi:hypothetical protein